MPIATVTVPRSRSSFWRQEADSDEDPPIEEGDVTERESYWSDDDGSSSEEYNFEETVENGSKMIVDSLLQDAEISAP